MNRSDMAAMAATPTAAFISLLLPSTGVDSQGYADRGPHRLSTLELAQSLYEGLLPLAEQFKVVIAGGDVNCWNHPLAINVALLGTPGPNGPLRRTEAQHGDWIMVTGELGGSILGRHFTFTPRVVEAQQLRRDYTLHAGMDISDGLALDLWRLCSASGVGAVINAAAVPISAAAYELAGRSSNKMALEHALSDGEDFELLFTLPAAEGKRLLAEQPLTGVAVAHIGQVVAEAGLWLETPQGERQPLEPKGFQHGTEFQQGKKPSD